MTPEDESSSSRTVTPRSVSCRGRGAGPRYPIPGIQSALWLTPCPLAVALCFPASEAQPLYVPPSHIVMCVLSCASLAALDNLVWLATGLPVPV
jgi:hypothetical protein